MHCNHHHHSFPHLSRKQMFLLYLTARQHAEDPGPPSAWDKFAAVIAGLAMLAALGALAVPMAGVLFVLVAAFLA